jgi:hypothetical protein
MMEELMKINLGASYAELEEAMETGSGPGLECSAEV